MRGLQLFTFGLVLVNEALCTTVMFPFVGKFITVLDPSMTQSNAGYYSGILVGSYQAAQAIFCSKWGHVSDVIGRKPVFLLGFCTGAFCMLMVGLSDSLWMAILFRILHGCFAANAPLAKTYAAEVTEKHNQAKAFGMLSVTWSIGAFAGPMIGGLLYDPQTSPAMSHIPFFANPDSIFATHPALLPCGFISLYTLVAALLTSWLLPESNMRAISLREWIGQHLSRGVHKTAYASIVSTEGVDRLDGENDDVVSIALKSRGEEPPSSLSTPTKESSEDETATGATPPGGRDGGASPTSCTPVAAAGDDTPSAGDTETHGQLGKFTWSALMAHPILKRCIPMYMTLCAYNIIYAEVLPLYAIAFQKDGGLEMSITSIGIIFTVNAVISVVMNLAFPHATARFEMLRLWRFCNLMFAATIVLYGATTSLNGFHSELATIGWISFLSLFRCTASTWCFSLSMMFVANAAPPEHLGRVTGMSHACGSMMRSVWPLIAAPLFAWSVSGPHWFPFDHYLVFVVSMLLALLAYYLSLSLNEDDVTKRTRATVISSGDEGVEGEDDKEELRENDGMVTTSTPSSK